MVSNVLFYDINYITNGEASEQKTIRTAFPFYFIKNFLMYVYVGKVKQQKSTKIKQHIPVEKEIVNVF